MSLSATNDESDILWISTRIPAIASIYYHLHLQKSHTLYCPDDTSPTLASNAATPPVKQHVRELARNILHVIDSNNYKKLALHFMEPLSTTRRDDLVRFLLKRRSRLTISHLTLPCPLVQHYYLSGWSHSIAHELNSFWPRQCQASPTHEPDSPSPYIPAKSTYTDMEFKQPFMLSSHEFTKKALFVYITQDMIILPGDIADRNANDEMDLFEFKDAALLAIQGWIDAISVSPSENGNTLIFIVDEASFYVGSTLQRSNQEERKKILAHGRNQLWKKIQSLATELPIYLYLNYFNLTSTKATLPGILAWLQQRHHLCVPRSILLTWKRYCFGTEENPGTDCHSTSIFTQLEQVELTSIAKYDRPKWKTEFIHLLQKIGNMAYTDQQYISPGKLNKDLLALEMSKQHTTPLLGGDEQPFDQLVHESSDFFDHSVSSSSEQVAHSWIIAVQQQQDSTIGTGDSATDSNDTKSDENNQNAIANMTDESRTEELENLADNLDHDKIRDYIANTGAYARGADLLHTLNQTTYSLDDEKDLLMVSAEAKGTSDKPYQVYLALDRKDDTKVITNGYCTCPVGKTGRCKHCVAVLLRFTINVDDFQQNQEQIVIPTVEQESTTKQPLRPSPNKNENASPSTNIPSIATSPAVEPSSSSSLSPQQSSPQMHMQQSPPEAHPQQESAPQSQIQKLSSPSYLQPSPSSSSSQANTETKAPSQRRVLPWDMGEQKTGRGKKRQRSAAKSTTEGPDAVPKDLSSIHEPATSTMVAAVKKPRRTNTRKKPKARRTVDSDSDADTIADSSLEPIKQQKAPARRSARTKQPITHTIDDAAMWEDDLDNASFIAQQRPPSAPASTAAFNSGIDDDDPVQLAATPTASSQLSPLRTMQQSNLSLPMTDLDLLTSKSDLVDDSDTQDEDDLPLSIPHMHRSQNLSLNKDKNEQQISGATDTQQPQPQQQLVYNAQKILQRSATSDLFDELDL